MPDNQSVTELLRDVRACNICAEHLPLGPRPVVQLHPDARILIAGQAPGSKVHASGIPFDDASGKRLREWMGMERETFYDARQLAILPMGFCYPGSGKSGDLPPRPECAPAWREKLMTRLPKLACTLVIGQYAQNYHFSPKLGTLTERVRNWRQTWPALIPLPHPSPRNNLWLKKNPWFEIELLPLLRKQIAEILR
jgi:uracil-DNA glycosylase